MIPPKGFRAELNPLQHKFNFVCGLNLGTAAINSTMMTMVKNYKGVGAPSGIVVNPKNAAFETETGCICAPMSIIDKFSYYLQLSLTEDALADGVESVRVQFMPIFTSFAHRLDETDKVTTDTVAALLELTKDATQEDVTPAYATKLSTGAAANEKNHPMSTANFTEVFGTQNLTTNVAMEGIPWNTATVFKALRYFTNKGALQSCMGTMRTIYLSKNKPYYNTYVRRRVPRDVRRIQPYSFLAMLVHVPLDSVTEQIYYTGAQTADKVAVGVKLSVAYNEWNIDHNQDMA